MKEEGFILFPPLSWIIGGKEREKEIKGKEKRRGKRREKGKERREKREERREKGKGKREKGKGKREKGKGQGGKKDLYLGLHNGKKKTPLSASPARPVKLSETTNQAKLNSNNE